MLLNGTKCQQIIGGLSLQWQNITIRIIEDYAELASPYSNAVNHSPICDISPSDLPCPPQSVLQIMRACSDDSIDHTQLAKIVVNDPVLTAELLRTVNSSFYGIGREVSSLNRAIAIVGQRALRNIVLCLSVKDLVRQHTLKDFDVVAFWEDTIRRAVSARLLAKLLKLDADDCFTLGLIQDFGMLVLFYLNPQQANLWESLSTVDPDSRLDLEQQHFASSHDHIGQLLAKAWQLPEDLSQALGFHHSVIGNSAASTLSKVLYCADWMSAVYACSDKGGIIDQCRCVLNDMLGVASAESNDLLRAVPEETLEAASMLGLKIKQQDDFEQVLREANIKLAEANLSYQELTWELEKTLQERDRLATELNRELELAREIQQSLLPLGKNSGYPVCAINVPARQLSGDFYDYYQLPDGRIYFNLGDVSGKGMNAALLMAKTSSLFRCLAKQIHSPGELLTLINSEICETSVRGMFVTMIAGLYDPVSGGISIVNAGNPPGLLFQSSGKVQLVEAQTPPLGVVSGLSFEEINIQLDTGSLYLFSDGVTESRVANGVELGVKGLAKWIKELQLLSPEQRLSTIVDRLKRHQKQMRDDITLLVIENKIYEGKQCKGIV